ncbi:MAG: hypothetical protein V9G10_00695 [Candidatus Nanopelagicales bacterium]
MQILDGEGNPVPAGTEGNIVIRLPLPPGTLPTLWNADERYVGGYLSAFPGYYTTGDGGYIDSDGYLYVLGRTDDVINVAGHRLSTGVIEAAVATHPDVAECAVIGVHDAMKGQIPRAFVVLKSGAQVDHGRTGHPGGGCGAGSGRPGCRAQGGRGGAGPAEDPFRQDPAPHHAGHRRRPRGAHPFHD